MKVPNDLSTPLLEEEHTAAAAPTEEDHLADEASPPRYPEPSAPPLDPEFDDEDRAALDEAAAAARRQCTELIRDHLHAHLSQNPESTYVTWVATLHPENATVTLDPRFHIPGNPWLAVYEEAQRDVYYDPNRGDEGSAEDGLCATSVHSEGGGPGHRGRARADDVDNGEDAPRKTYSGCVDLAVGFILALTGMAAALCIELFGLPIYMCKVLCQRITMLCSPPNICTILPLIPFWTLFQLFRLVDALLLVFSVIMVEFLAVIGMVLCTPLALSFSVGLVVHQRIRKLAHLTRWAFRQCFGGWLPSKATSSQGGGVEDNRSGQGGNVLEESAC